MCLPPVRDRWEESCHSTEGMCCVPWREDGCLSLQSTRRRNEKHHSDPTPSGERLCLRKTLAFKEPKGGNRDTRQGLLYAQRLRPDVGAVHSCSGHAQFAPTMK